MTKKRYEVRGMMEWHPVFVAGKARVQVSFTGGYLGDGCSTPARFETADEVVQRVIENSDAFRKGRIRLAAAWGTPAPVRRKAAGPPAAKIPEKKEPAVKAGSLFEEETAGEADVSVADSEPVLEFDTLSDAADWLAMECGAKRSQLFTKDQCYEAAAQYGKKISIKN